MIPRVPDPVRSCLGCRRRVPRSDLIRVVRDPGGEATFDVTGRLPGRGAYVHPSPSCLDALREPALAHVLRAPARLAPPAARRAELARLLERRAADLMGIARKTRAAVAGPAATRAALRSGRLALVLLGGARPDDGLRVLEGAASTVPAAALSGPEALGRLVGRERCAVAGVCNPGLAAALARTLGWRREISQDSWHNEMS